VVKLAVTFAVAVTIARLVERPLRRAPPRATATLGLVAALASVGLVAALVIPASAPLFDAAPADVVEAMDLRPTSTPPPPLLEDGALRRPARLMLVGDSTGRSFGPGLLRWTFRNRDRVRTHVATRMGCGLLTGGLTGNITDGDRAVCDHTIQVELPQAMRALHPDVVAVVISGADAFPRAWDGGPLRTLTDPEFTRHLERDYAAFFAAAAASGVQHVVWLRPPVYGDPPDPSFFDGGQDVIERVIREQAARYPGRVELVDYRGWFEAEHLDEQPVRPDGVHLEPEVADRVAAEYLGPLLLDIAMGR
jgi:hypothetical protein